eukprot:3832414-Lingulodinium_polyedra.AAC.1
MGPPRCLRPRDRTHCRRACGWPLGAAVAFVAQRWYGRHGQHHPVESGYDPVVHATNGPIYVDDLSGLIVGVESPLRLHYFLLA